MPLTFLLLSLPVSIGAFLIVFAIAFLHELFVVDPHKCERRSMPPNRRQCRPALVRYAPRKKTCFKRPAATYLANT
jgi:hypothetical protein